MIELLKKEKWFNLESDGVISGALPWRRLHERHLCGRYGQESLTELRWTGTWILYMDIGRVHKNQNTNKHSSGGGNVM